MWLSATERATLGQKNTTSKSGKAFTLTKWQDREKAASPPVDI